MPSSQFNLILKGVFPGVDAEKAHADFAALFSLTAEKVANLFASENAILKTGITQEIAEKYITRLATIGVNAIAESQISEDPLNNKDDLVVSEEPLAPEPAFNTDSNNASSETAVSSHSESEQLIADPHDVTVQNVQQKQHHAFTFTGNGTEYFKIWIVNILLSIVTLGVYSAWAKVRNKQYFYGNTHLADNTFEYTAEPIKILKGRAIAFVLYLALIFANHISPIASVIATVVFLLFLPLIIVNSLKFNARHSSYRNISFRFSGTIWGAVKVFILWPLAGIFTFGILFPFAWKRQAQYITNNHSYGAEPFRFDVHVKEYFIMLMILMGVFFAFIMVLVGVVAGIAVATTKSGGTFDPKSMFFIIPFMIAYVSLYLVVGAYVITTMANIHWNNTKLQKHQFTSNWTTPSYMNLLFTNTLGILFTLGLFIPFAKVRAATYKANHMAFIAEGNLDNFIANELEQSNSLAEGVHDIFDIDISI